MTYPNKLIAGLLILLCTITVISCKDKKKEDNGDNNIPVVVYTEEDRAKMSDFLSTFTEIGFWSIDSVRMFEPGNPDMIRFGIWHNYTRHFYDRVKECKDKNCKNGPLTIDGKYVQQTIKRYFDIDNYELFSVSESDPPFYYDGQLYHFNGSDGESTYNVHVDSATQNAQGQVVMTGKLYNVDDESNTIATVEAIAKPYNYEGEDTWAIVSMKYVRN